MRRPHGVICTPSRRHAACFHALRPLAPPQSLGLAHRASPSFGRVATRRVPQCIDRFGPADSHPPPPHVQGATLLTRPRGDAVGFALRVAAAFAGRGLSPLLRSLAFAFSRPVLPPRLLRHSAISELAWVRLPVAPKGLHPLREISASPLMMDGPPEISREGCSPFVQRGVALL